MSFSDASRADSCFISSAHETAYHDLLDGIRTHEGCIFLTGEAGSGKTFLLQHLLHDSPVAIQFVYCSGGGLDFDQLLGFICDELALPLNRPDRPARLRAINNYLDTCVERGTVVALLLDDAHNLSETVLNHLLMMFSARAGRARRALRLLFCGLPSLRMRIDKPQTKATKLNNPLYIYLNGLSPSETASFIRLNHPEHVFSRTEINEINRLSGGMPGVIAELCKTKAGPEQTADVYHPLVPIRAKRKNAKQRQTFLPALIPTLAAGFFFKRIKHSTLATAALSLALVVASGMIIINSMDKPSTDAITDPIKSTAVVPEASPQRELPTLTPISRSAVIAGLSISKPVTAAEKPPTRSTADTKNAELQLWQETQHSGTPDAYQAYLDTYPNGVFTAIAKTRLQQSPAQTDRSVVVLLDKARVALDKKALTTPDDDNAVKWAEAALHIDPNNTTAKEILGVVVDKYLYWSAQKLDHRQLQSANHFLTKAQSLQHYASRTQSAAVEVLDREIQSRQRSATRNKTTKRSSKKRKRYAKRTNRSNQTFASWIDKIDSRMRRLDQRMTQRFGKSTTSQHHSRFSSAR